MAKAYHILCWKEDTLGGPVLGTPEFVTLLWPVSEQPSHCC